ncbi:MerR family transcriptional regulator [Actinotalea sp. BY-33]|uniref:MerR family transcriptional regulator n=1 Tax=Actinotalea soli TaxID=2819234 RepID=A0A939RV60_9CELL|nr:MerR family transcriptional regulator [Actinotalea soli]MBO1753399.1 MerR family transcriptional regulator [Actinotalea soli]
MGMTPSDEHLLRIGDLSRLSMISVRMLRHYDEHGVLRPTRVDPDSGYRLYSSAQLRTAARVRELRDVGLGVAELARCVPLLDDADAMREVLAEHRLRLETEAGTVADRIRGVDHLITALEEPLMSIEITHRTVPARTVASLRDTIPTYADEGLLWQRLMVGLPAAGAVPAEDPRSVAVFHDPDHVEAGPDVEVQLDVVGPFASDGEVACVEVPEQEVAVGVLRGSYDGISEVMEALGRWVPENGYTFAGPMFNVYVVSPQEDHDPSRWVTEVCMPVTRG